jgi:hypothetical protein
VIDLNNSFFDAYTFEWPGGDLTVTMDSSAFDEYMIIYQPPGAPTGLAMDVNDTTMETEVFELEDAPAGQYTIWANCFVRATGAYEVCVGQSNATPNPTPTSSQTPASSPTSTQPSTSTPSPTTEPSASSTPTPLPIPTSTPTSSLGCDAPKVPSNPQPESGSIDISMNPTLSWTGGPASKSNRRIRNAESKVIYGEDNRLDVYEVDDPDLRAVAESVVMIVDTSDLTDNGSGMYTLDSMTFNDWLNGELCPDEPFRDQPAPGACSGFLAAPDLVVTAGGGCVGDECPNTAFVFGFHMLDATTPKLTIPAEDVYFCDEVLVNVETSGADYSIIRLDREVENRSPLPIRRDGKIAADQDLIVVGYPFGLPTKIAGGASVRDNSNADYFVANLDTYLGSAGSPVLNADTLVVEGVMVRGEEDFDTSGSCVRSNVCPDDGCAGEDSTRTTVFADQVPESVEYDVYFGPSGEEEFVGTTDETSWPLSDLDPNVYYCWRVVARSPCGESESRVWGFKTAGEPVDCDSGYYLLDSFGARHRVGDPTTINGELYFGYDIARDMERAECSSKGLTGNEDLIVLDGMGAVHFVSNDSCDIPQDFYFEDTTGAFPQGRAVDVEMTKDSMGLCVLTDFGAIYRAGTAKDPADPGLLPGSDRSGVFGFDVPMTGALRRAGFPDPGGATLRAVALILIDTDLDSQAEGYVTLDSMGGRVYLDSNGDPIPGGASAGAPANDPSLLLDPDAYAWPFFPGLDIARDMELHPSDQGVAILDGWDGIHPVPVSVGSNPVFFAKNAVSESNLAYRSANGMPYIVAGFDEPATVPDDESNPAIFGADAYSVFIDLEFSAGCQDGLYTLNRFGGIFTLGAARKVADDPGAGFGDSPYFFPNLYARDIEIFSSAERETETRR